MTAVELMDPATTMDEGLRCALCDYDLRGLPEPRCPECGFGASSWPELRRQILEIHPYLFEHHPEQPHRARARTLVAGLNPWRFWKSVLPTHAIYLRRLIFYWLGWAILALIPLTLLVAHLCAITYLEMHTGRDNMAQYFTQPGSEAYRMQLIKKFGSLENARNEIYPLPPSRAFFQRVLHQSPAPQLLGMMLATALLWPIVVPPAMLMFSITLRRARIRPAQILRCSIYTFDAVVPFVLLLLLAVLWMLLEPVPAGTRLWAPPWHAWHQTIAYGALVGGALLAIVLAIRLGVAFGRYLRLRHAMLTAFLVQIVILLIAAKLFYVALGS